MHVPHGYGPLDRVESQKSLTYLEPARRDELLAVNPEEAVLIGNVVDRLLGKAFPSLDYS